MTNSTVYSIQDQDPSSVSKPFANLTSLLAHLSSYDSQQKERQYLKVKQEKNILFWMFQYHVLHRRHRIWINIFIISKNLRAARLVQNQVELSPVFDCVLSFQSLKKPELGMNIWYHLLSKVVASPWLFPVDGIFCSWCCLPILLLSIDLSSNYLLNITLNHHKPFVPKNSSDFHNTCSLNSILSLAVSSPKGGLWSTAQVLKEARIKRVELTQLHYYISSLKDKVALNPHN